MSGKQARLPDARLAKNKHFELTIEDQRFDFRILEDEVAAEAALDGQYVIRTSVPKQRMSADDTVCNYKALSDVERAFRSLKTVNLKVPIHHRLETRVRAYIFLCMLAYYVEWHVREARRELLLPMRINRPELPKRSACRQKRRTQNHVELRFVRAAAPE